MGQPIREVNKTVKAESGASEQLRVVHLPKGQLNAAGQNRKPLLDEREFQEVFCWERKRAERSGKPFLLMLLDARNLLRERNGAKLQREIISALPRCSRETDVAGWYRRDAILGMLFTEIDGHNRTELVSVLQSKVRGALSLKLTKTEANQIGISFHIFPDVAGPAGSGTWIDTALYPDMAEPIESRRVSRAIKRAVDIAASLLALAIGSPLFAIVAVAIKLDSKGPIFLKQTRIGQQGVPFTLLKFRSMIHANDPSVHWEYVRRFIAGEIDPGADSGRQNAIYKLQGDSRITRVGRILRRLSLDELPQFVNVFRGEMSLVGPRPPLPYEVEAYKAWHRCRVLEVKPGITGLWQVTGRSRVKFDDMVRFDLRYARSWTLWTDVKIILKTPFAIVNGEGAY